MESIPLHSRVALVDGAESVYAFALAGTEGWVRDRKKDEDGFEMVKVEWDRDHWRYNGQPDCWTFTDHFKVVGPPEPFDEDGEGESKELEPPASADQLENYMDTLTQAMDAASEGEGFFVLTVRRVPNPESPGEILYVPQLFSHSTSEAASILLDIQLAECAAQTYEEMVAHLVHRLKKEGNG